MFKWISKKHYPYYLVNYEIECFFNLIKLFIALYNNSCNNLDIFLFLENFQIQTKMYSLMEKVHQLTNGAEDRSVS